MALNEDMHLTVSFPTVPFGDVGGKTVSQLAVEDALFRDEGDPGKYLLMQTDIQRFEQARTTLMSEAAAEVRSWCQNFDQFFLPETPPPGFAGYYAPHWYSAAVGHDLPENSSCEDMAYLCDVDSGSLVRFVCGQTCCSRANRHSAWYKVKATGCPAGCLQEADENPAAACVDVPANATPWQAFWDLYPIAIENHTGQSLANNTVGTQIAEMVQTMKVEGCPALNTSRWGREVVMNLRWCEGFEPLFAPLARLCPESCGCANLADPSQAPPGCPSFCTPRCEDKTFPAIGPVSTCAEGAVLGWCFDAGFAALCRKSCTGC